MKTWEWVLAGLCVAYVAALAAVASGPSGGVIAFLRNPATAAWVQAIGSIMAIVVAVIVAQHSAAQGRHTALEMQNREVAGRLEVAIHVANQALVVADQVRKRLEGGDNPMGPVDFDSVTDALAAVPVGEMRSGPLVAELMSIGRVTRSIGNISNLFEANHGLYSADAKAMFLSQFALKEVALHRAYERVVLAGELALGKLNASHRAGPTT